MGFWDGIEYLEVELDHLLLRRPTFEHLSTDDYVTVRHSLGF